MWTGEGHEMKIGIIGAGMAGLACAQVLKQAGHDVSLFDKGRGPGGRMSTRKLATAQGEAGFDHGAQYFTARDGGFSAQVAQWCALGVAAAWPQAGCDAFVGTPAMNAPIKALAADQTVHFNSRIDRISNDDAGWTLNGINADIAFIQSGFSHIVLALPAEQTAPLVAAYDEDMADHARATPAQPCWTIMLAFDGRVDFAPDTIRAAGAIGWAARNSAKPARSGPEAWVIQATPEWTRAHLDLSGEVVSSLLLNAFAKHIGTGLPELLGQSAHRWLYARSGTLGISHLWNPALKLGCCGDWLLGPRVEAAWMSGTALAARILAG
eukprot:gene2427-2462_t